MPISNPVSPRYTAAVHESGHAVYALVMGWSVERVVLHQDGRYDGACRFSIRDGAPPAEVAGVYLAGILAAKFTSRDTNIETARDDIGEVARLTAGIDLDNLVLLVRRRLASLWAEIDRLATELNAARSLDQGEILRAIKTPVSWLRS